MNHLDHIEELEPTVAALIGLDWRALPIHSREKIREALRHVPRNGGQTDLEQAAGKAIDAWYTQHEEKREAERLAAIPAETSHKTKPSPKAKQ